MNSECEWVDFFKEMSEKILNYRTKQKDLVGILASAKVNGLQDKTTHNSEATVLLNEIDPFTFTTLIIKHSDSQRTKILQEIKSALKINAIAPTHFRGVPNVDPRQAWLFPYKRNRKDGDISKLWDLYEEVVRNKKITDSVFSAAQGVKFAGKAKLTQAIFRAAPDLFFPVDGQTTRYLERLGLSSIFKTAEEYEEICKQTKKLLNSPLYVQSYDAWLSNQSSPTEGDYQQAALRKAVKVTKNKEHKEAAGGIKAPAKTKNTATGGYKRNPSVAASALRKAEFQCEINSSHTTFSSNATKSPYVEAHHLIPISKQGLFNYSLDVTANIIALCPNCHRLLHHGIKTEKISHLQKLLDDRGNYLEEKKINIKINRLIDFYHQDLPEEDA